MADPKKVKIVSVSSYRHDGKVIEVGEVIEVPESVATDILGTNRALPATDENIKIARDLAKAIKAKPTPITIKRPEV